jgi:hypothetical protein
MRSKQKSPNRELNPKPRTCTAAAARESFLHGATGGRNLMRLAADACCLVLPYHAARRGSSFSHSRRRPPADPHSRRQLACRRCSTAAVSRTDWSTPATGHQPLVTPLLLYHHAQTGALRPPATSCNTSLLLEINKHLENHEFQL